MTQITLKMQAGAKPAVMTLLDGRAKVGSKNQFICYPAIKFPGVKNEIALIQDGETEPKNAKSHAAAEKIAIQLVKDVVAKAKEKLAAEKAKKS